MANVSASFHNMISRFADLKVVRFTAPIAQIAFCIASFRQFIPLPRSSCEGPEFNIEEILVPTVYFFLFKIADCLVKRSVRVSDLIQIFIFVTTYYFYRVNLR
jgi:hypothetical protein